MVDILVWWCCGRCGIRDGDGDLEALQKQTMNGWDQAGGWAATV